eukprot:365326-Chlamydomonas_euryale.AAC.6
MGRPGHGLMAATACATSRPVWPPRATAEPSSREPSPKFAATTARAGFSGAHAEQQRRAGGGAGVIQPAAGARSHEHEYEQVRRQHACTCACCRRTAIAALRVDLAVMHACVLHVHAHQPAMSGAYDEGEDDYKGADGVLDGELDEDEDLYYEDGLTEEELELLQIPEEFADPEPFEEKYAMLWEHVSLHAQAGL